MEYLSAKHIIKLNAMQIEIFSSGEMVGVKDNGALEASVSQPQQEIFGKELYPTIAEKGAILVINLVKKHPFHNANKRTAFMALDIFMNLNNCPTLFEQEEMVDFVVRIATHEVADFEELKAWATKEIKDHRVYKTDI